MKRKFSVFDDKGSKTGEIELEVEARKDILENVLETGRRRPAYANDERAGKKHSATGKIRHARRKWKTACGYGISRVPRKIMTRKGSRFNWVGAGISGMVGGRESHPPKAGHFVKIKKINTRMMKKALLSFLNKETVVFSKLPKKTKDIKKAVEKTGVKGRTMLIKKKEEDIKNKFFDIINVEDVAGNLAKMRRKGIIFTEKAIKEFGK